MAPLLQIFTGGIVFTLLNINLKLNFHFNILKGVREKKGDYLVNTYMTEGVGKRIVDALKKQNEIEAFNQQTVQTPQETIQEQEPVHTVNDEFPEFGSIQNEIPETPVMNAQPAFSAQINPQVTMQNTMYSPMNSSLADFGGLEVPQNVAVLRQLIAQLPSGVSRQAGALVIKQTMEALGISMKSVLQEAQQLQENINMSARDCQNSILECKKQINTLEAQVQKYQKQSASLNDIVSLFIQIN